MRRVKSTEVAIFHLIVKRVTRGSIIFGLLAGLMNALQGIAYATTYSEPEARKEFVTTVMSNPAFGMLYGAPEHIDAPSGYMVFRCLNFLSFVAAVWGLLFITRMLRGQEENGRWEQLLSGQTTTSRMTSIVLAGASVGVGISFAIATAILIPLGHYNQINISVSSAIFYALALVLMILPSMALGVFTSQLAATRRRAVTYGLIPLVVLFLMRGIGTSIEKMAWLKDFTPFGWIAKLHPVFDPQPLWLIPILLCIFIFAGLGIYLAGKRDVGESFVRESDTHAPRLTFVRGPILLAMRLTGPMLFFWMIGAVSVMSLIAALSKAATDSLQSSPALHDALATLAGSHAVTFAFLGMGGLFMAMMIMVLTAVGLGTIRSDESKGYLDNFLVHPLSRQKWLFGRVAIIIGVASLTCLIGTIAAYGIVSLQNFEVSASQLIIGGLNWLGPVFVLFGIGILLYGTRPRFAVTTMYIVLSWSFLIDMIRSVVSLKPIIAQTSLLHYLALVPAAQPNWRTFVILICVSSALIAIGVYSFSRRDLVTE